MTLEDLKLVHVAWGEDEGLVSLALGKVLVYAYGKRLTFVTDDSIPFVELTNAEMDAAYDEPTWEDVVDYLTRVKGMK